MFFESFFRIVFSKRVLQKQYSKITLRSIQFAPICYRLFTFQHFYNFLFHFSKKKISVLFVVQPARFVAPEFSVTIFGRACVCVNQLNQFNKYVTKRNCVVCQKKTLSFKECNFYRILPFFTDFHSFSPILYTIFNVFK